MNYLLPVAVLLTLTCGAMASDSQWKEWPPRDYLVASLVNAIPQYISLYHPETGKFNSEPWGSGDQNYIYPMAVAWSTEHPDNPYYHDPEILKIIARAGEVLTEQQDAKGMWLFTKRDGSTWGMIHMPWTYSRWIRAYQIVKDALPEDSRKVWETGLRLGYKGIRSYADGGVHNIPTHHAMGLYIAGEVFENPEWQEAAKKFMARVIDEQSSAGFWSEHYGPVTGYGSVYVEALGIYYSYSHDPVALKGIGRASEFYSNALLPDGSTVQCIDERTLYSSSVNIGNLGFSWTPEGRGYLLQQVWRYSNGGKNYVNGEYAAAMLMHGVSGDAIMPSSAGDSAVTIIGDNDAAVTREKPWAWGFSGYVCDPPQNRWIQDRINLIDVYHDELGLVIGGGNTKLQPYWSTFTVGDPEVLKHKDGDEAPNFTPDVDLKWTADSSRLATKTGSSRMKLMYGDTKCVAVAQANEDDTLTLTYMAPKGQRVEGHIPLMYRGPKITLGTGEIVRLTEERMDVSSEQAGGYFVYRNLKVTLPKGTRLMWPARQHNPYTKDGHSGLSAAKLVMVLPFENSDRYDVTLSYQAPEPFDGIAFEARDIPFVNSEGTYTKRLDDLGSQFIGSTKIGSTLTFTLPEVKPGRYELLGEFVLFSSYGIVQVRFDGQPVGQPFDGYFADLDAEGAQASFGTVEIGLGEHTVAIEIIGQNERSAGHIFSVKRWLLKPVD